MSEDVKRPTYLNAPRCGLDFGALSFRPDGHLKKKKVRPVNVDASVYYGWLWKKVGAVYRRLEMGTGSAVHAVPVVVARADTHAQPGYHCSGSACSARLSRVVACPIVR